MPESPVVRISRGWFAPEALETVRRIIVEGEATLVPAISGLRGLLYYHASVDAVTNSVVNVSIWEDLAAAEQMSTLQAMLAQRPIMESANVRFDPIANYGAAEWTIDPLNRMTH